MDVKDHKYSAKKPTLFIELHNFSFRRDMFQTDTEDFIGRKHIRNRLKAILNYTKACSGTYLITGSRGVGKTSLVNKVLSELSQGDKISAGMIRFLTLIISMLIITGVMKVFNLYEYESSITPYVIISIIIIAIIVLLRYICCYSSYRKKEHLFNYNLNIIIRELILWNKKPNRAGKTYQFAKIFTCVLMIQLLYIVLIGLAGHEKIPSPPIICLIFGIYLWMASMIRNMHNLFSKADKLNNRNYREFILYSKSTSYAIAACIVIIPLILIAPAFAIMANQLHLPCWVEVTMWLIAVTPVISVTCLLFRIHKLTKDVYKAEGLKEKISKRYKRYEKPCLKLLKNAIGEFISFKNWINRPRQVFVKINLGYEELKSVDVLRLISHNITIEYRKYIYSGSFYWLRTFIVTVVCLGCTLFFDKYVKYNFKVLFRTEHVPINDTIKLTLNSLYTFFHNVYDQISLALSYLLYFLSGLFDTDVINYINLNSKIQPKETLFTFEQFLFFLFLVFLYKITAYLPVLKHHVRAPYSNLSDLIQLQDSIIANIKTEDNIKAENKLTNILSWGYNRKVEKDYPMLDAHDIEKRLIDIMTDISRGWLFQSPQFIIIFDELDKIESEESKKGRMSKTDSFSPDTIRLRQEAIFELLSGLKYILSTMPAKFIFVAGREMYEASLADASDRSHYLSSIFDDVINVPSFMSDFSDDKSYDICSMTEQYLCRHLFPSGYIVKEYSLKEYGRYMENKDNEYIEKTYSEKNRKKIKDKTEEEWEIERLINQQHLSYERESLLMHLNNFITYLTYAGKGAPKKMISLMDKFVVKLQPHELSEAFLRADKGLTISPIVKQYYSNSNYFLKFDFYEQYTVALMARMIMPVMYRFSHRNIHQYGDKLLVSTLFFIDHLYKFHSHSFSWRALASSPELIDVNKTPELRNHITDILHFLTQNDLKSISNGLYDFRFFKVMAQEISFMTRVSETSSATFDFSLDESLAVKQYYERRLVNQRKSYEADRIQPENTIFELADQHFTLGELYLYDEDMDNAIVEFDAAISIIQTLKPEKMTPETIVALIKNMLSLGIAYEEQSLNDQAYLVYSGVVKLIVASRNTNIGKLGLTTFESVLDGKMKVRQSETPTAKTKEPGLYFEEKTDVKFQKETSLMELLDNIPHLHPDIHLVISKITTYDGLQLLYLPLLAKFQILEKSQIGGIQKEDIRRLLKEFYFLVNMVNKGNKSLICASFYLKLGNILYYKNSHLMQDTTMMQRKLWPFSVYRECYLSKCDFKDKGCGYKDKCKFKTDESVGCDDERMCRYSSQNQFWNISINNDALVLYIHSLFLIINKTDYVMCSSIKRLFGQLKELKEKEFEGWDDTRFNMLGKAFSCIGDIFLSETDTDNKLENSKALQSFMTDYFEQRKSTSALDTLKSLVDKRDINERIVKIAILYLLSVLFYRKATAYNMVGYLYMKLLTLLKYNATGKCSMEETGRELLKRAIRNTSSAFKDISFGHTQDTEDILKDAKIINSKGYNKHSLLYTEAFESILAYYGIQLASIEKINAEDYEKKVIKLYEEFFGTVRYDIHNNIYNRIKLLKFKSEMNYRWLKAIIEKNGILNSKVVCKIDTEESFYQSGLKKLTQNLLIPHYYTSFFDASRRHTQGVCIAHKFRNSRFWIASKKGDTIDFRPKRKLELEEKEKIAFLVRDSLFNLNEILKFVQIYGETFLLTNVFVADTYDKITYWLQLKQWIEKTKIADNESKKSLSRLIGENYYKESQECWNWANAVRFYYKAEETHEEGRSYKDMINRACFLNDEFSDQRLHFITAQEREKVNEHDYKKNVRNVDNEKAKEYFNDFKIAR